ncbi:MAG TPA: YHS domain-containing protein [Candidatus Eisenbacteria bacterium]|uniref:YHS domain-containing protein n=1 Tax=Eiseniibacteriota bacterium TaxID=2212470 RepID=A0A7V2ATH7_UNCEI|nr:YHS domain-containing protein [Candidatus Eisenbacteria bacterium]
MKNTLLICIMLSLVLSLGCGKKEEPARTEQTESVVQEKPRVVARTPQSERPEFDEKFRLVDPVSNEKLMGDETPITYVYKKKLYFFKNEENLRIFKENPDKYVTESE